MDKKEILLKILTQLEPIWNLAKGLKILVENGNLGDDMLDSLIEAVEGAISTAKSKMDKEKMQKGLNVMKKIKEIESKSTQEDKKDLDELDKMLDNF